MKLSDFSKQGLYVCAKFSEQTLDDIEALQTALKVPNPVPRSKIHSTILYSRVNVPYIAASGSFEVAESGTLEVWDTQDGKTLVMKLESDYLTTRHKYGRAIGGTHDFPDYTPHVTLSYNVGALKFEGSHKLKFVLSHEKAEPLQLDWKP
ncbi:RNA ligase [Serratia phage 4S]|nr:RNA ligase [Serratia phage 4S]